MSLFLRFLCLLEGHVSGGIYLGWTEAGWRRSCLRCHREFVERDDDEELYDALRDDDLILDENLAALAGEAGTAGTTKIDPVHEHATRQGNAQRPPQ